MNHQFGSMDLKSVWVAITENTDHSIPMYDRFFFLAYPLSFPAAIIRNTLLQRIAHELQEMWEVIMTVLSATAKKRRKVLYKEGQSSIQKVASAMADVAAAK